MIFPALPHPFLFYSITITHFFALLRTANGEKTLCEHRNYIVSSKPHAASTKPLYYYQRLELPDAVDCVERCIETGEYCRAVLWIGHAIDEEKVSASSRPMRSSINKKKNYCQFYASNSEDPDIKGKEIGSEAPADGNQYTLFEIVDMCSRPSPLAKRLNASSRKALEFLKSSSDINRQTTVKPVRAITASVDFRTRENDLRDEGVAKGKFPQSRPKAITEGVDDADILTLMPSNGKRANEKGRFHRDQPYRTGLTDMEAGSLAATDGLEPIRPAVVSRGGFASAPLSSAFVDAPKHSSQLQQPHSSVSIPYAPSSSGASKKVPCPARPGSGDACAPRESPTPVWTEWSSSGVCSVTCGAGRRKMHRYCSGRKSDDCEGDAVKEEPCEMPECNQWADWSEWGRCSASCGNGGHKTRHRTCQYGDACEGSAQQRERCSSDEVPRECPEWMPWSSWGECSVTCDRGSQHRERACNKKGGTMECSEMGGHSTDHQNCEMKPCPAWASWQQWGECSKSCGGGERVRQRECLNGDAGEDCTGPATEHMICNTHPCPQWGSWAQWGPCSTTCGDDGTRLRSRECTYQGRLSTDCEGSAQDESPCQQAPCPHWAQWAEWSKCSTSCGHGQQLRVRECTPRGFGCKGGDREIRFCQLAVCPYFSAWSEWSGCSVTCGRGTCERRRKCIENSPVTGAGVLTPTEDESSSNTTGDGTASSGSTGGGGSLEPINGPTKATTEESTTKRSTAKNTKNESDSDEEIETSERSGQGKEVDKARLIERAKHLPATDVRMQRVKLREHHLEVPQSTSMMLSKRRRSPIRAMTVDDMNGVSQLAEMSPHSSSMAIVPTNARGPAPSSQSQKSQSASTCVGPEVEYKDCDAGPCCEWGEWAAWSSCRPPSRPGPDGCDEEERRGESSPSSAALGSRSRSRICEIDRASSSIMSVSSIPISRGAGGSFSTDLPYRGHVAPVPISASNNDFYRTGPPRTSRYSNSGLARGKRQTPFYRQQQQQPPAYPFSGVQAFGRQPQSFMLSRSKNEGDTESALGDEQQCCVGPATESEECHATPATEGPCGERSPTARRPHFQQDEKKRVTETQKQCFWAAWSAWRECSGSCSQAERSRERGCIKHGNSCECKGDDLESKDCKPKNCSSSTSTNAAHPPKMLKKEPLVLPASLSNQSSKSMLNMEDADHDPVLSCYWSEWTEWSRCQRGDYLKQRSRFCVGLRALINNCECMGASIEQTACGTNASNSTQITGATTAAPALVAMRQQHLPAAVIKKRVETEITPLSASEAEPAVKLQSRIIRPLKDPETRASRQLDATPITNGDTADNTKEECEWAPWSEWSRCSEEGDCKSDDGIGKEKSRSRRCPCRSCGGGIAEESASCPLLSSCTKNSQ